MSDRYPGQSDSEARESTGENAQLSVGEQAYRAAGSPEIPPGPVPQRMSSGAHFNPQQFVDHVQEVDEPEVPDVHRNPTAYYGQDDDRYGGCNAT